MLRKFFNKAISRLTTQYVYVLSRKRPSGIVCFGSTASTRVAREIAINASLDHTGSRIYVHTMAISRGVDPSVAYLGAEWRLWMAGPSKGVVRDGHGVVIEGPGVQLVVTSD